MQLTHEIKISKGTKVLSFKNEVIELVADVLAYASIQKDGGFIYSVGRNKYYCSAGNCHHTPITGETQFFPHENALVPFI